MVSCRNLVAVLCLWYMGYILVTSQAYFQQKLVLVLSSEKTP